MKMPHDKMHGKCTLSQNHRKSKDTIIRPAKLAVQLLSQWTANYAAEILLSMRPILQNKNPKIMRKNICTARESAQEDLHAVQQPLANLQAEF